VPSSPPPSNSTSKEGKRPTVIMIVEEEEDILPKHKLKMSDLLVPHRSLYLAFCFSISPSAV
jgi:hypothetical protein